MFDGSGLFLRRIGSEGDGPGEFRSPAGLAVLAGDTIVVWDRGLQRVSWFSRGGTLERELTLRQPGGIRTVRQVVLSPSGAVVVLGARTTEVELGNQGRVRERWQLVRLEQTLDTTLLLGTMPGPERVVHVQGSGDGEVVSVRVEGRWWWGEGFAWASERGVWTADRLSLEARHFDLERGLDHVVRVAAPDRPFTRALIDSLERVELERVADPELRSLWRADFEGREYPEGVPPVEGIFADAAARVWIGLTDPPPERLSSRDLMAVRRWMVFERNAPGEGEETPTVWARGVLTLPPRSHPLWANAEGVLLIRNDTQTDAAYVEWYSYVDG